MDPRRPSRCVWKVSFRPNTHPERPSLFPQNRIHTPQGYMGWVSPIQRLCWMRSWWPLAVWGRCTQGCSSYRDERAYIEKVFSRLLHHVSSLERIEDIEWKQSVHVLANIDPHWLSLFYSNHPKRSHTHTKLSAVQYYHSPLFRPFSNLTGTFNVYEQTQTGTNVVSR